MRRIFPALIFTVILTYVAGALWCSPLMFLDVAKEGTHALLWISNIQYWRESHQYFAPNSDELALLHCWSLSLEEQFYLIWPLFIVLAHRFGRTFEAIAIAAVASLLSSILVTQDRSVRDVLSDAVPHLRVRHAARWCSSSRAACRSAGRPRKRLSAVGVVAIVASAMTFDSAMAHMDVAALLPCLGAAAVIWPVRNEIGATDHPAGHARARRDLLFALSLPLADHLLWPLHFRRRCRHGSRPSRPGRRDGPARDRHVLFRRAAGSSSRTMRVPELPQERCRLLVGDTRARCDHARHVRLEGICLAHAEGAIRTRLISRISGE